MRRMSDLTAAREAEIRALVEKLGVGVQLAPAHPDAPTVAAIHASMCLLLEALTAVRRERDKLAEGLEQLRAERREAGKREQHVHDVLEGLATTAGRMEDLSRATISYLQRRGA